MRRMSHPLPFLEEAHAGLVRHFGLSEFRPGQAEVISAVLSGRNAVVVMPTGAGKSLCFQLPASLLPRMTLVISPLIALMKDQVEQLLAKGISATFINSTLTDLERAERMRGLRNGEYKLLYVAPERFRSAAFLETVAELGVDLFAIDEAHCISQWGHDFRPDYALLGRVRKRLRPPRTVALTATATPEVRDDIVKSLLMKDPQVFVAGFDRPNLFLEVAQVSGEQQRKDAIAKVMAEGGSGIIYCATRKSAEAIHQAIRSQSRSTVLYHAGMDEQARHKAQDEFMARPDSVAVATNAFGMGIDKPDIRFVIHANMPRAVEAYYQEIGRAGRNGNPARAILLFNHSDVFTQERMIQSSSPSDALMSDLWEVLREEQEFDKPIKLLAGQVNSSETEVSAALRILERDGKISRGGRGEGQWTVTVLPKAETAHPHSPHGKALLELLRTGYPIGSPVTTDVTVLARRTSMSTDEVKHAMGLLEKAHAVSVRRPFSGRAIRVLTHLPYAQLGLDLSRVRDQERLSLLQLRRMKDYAYATRCRRHFILRYFGEQETPARCEACDLCVGKRLHLAADSASGSAALVPGEHSELAEGELRRWRRDLARDLDIPPYLIFNDATLLALATSLPIDHASFLRVKGTSEAKWERFGAKISQISLTARAAGHQPRAPASTLRLRRKRA